jgi:hypothetical protein
MEIGCLNIPTEEVEEYASRLRNDTLLSFYEELLAKTNISSMRDDYGMAELSRLKSERLYRIG